MYALTGWQSESAVIKLRLVHPSWQIFFHKLWSFECSISASWMNCWYLQGWTTSSEWVSSASLAIHKVTMQYVWLAHWADKINQILRCDWLPKRARRRYLTRLGLRARKKNRPLSMKLVWSGWLEIGLRSLFCIFHKHARQNLANYLRLGQ